MRNYIHTLKIDIDLDLEKFKWMKDYKRMCYAVLNSFGYKITKFIIHRSPSQKGFHIYIYISSKKKLSSEEIIKLEYLLLNDPTRTIINLNRSKFIDDFDVLFDKVIWKKEQPENCQRCKLLKFMRKIYEEKKDGIQK